MGFTKVKRKVKTLWAHSRPARAVAAVSLVLGWITNKGIHANFKLDGFGQKGIALPSFLHWSAVISRVFCALFVTGSSTFSKFFSLDLSHKSLPHIKALERELHAIRQDIQEAELLNLSPKQTIDLFRVRFAKRNYVSRKLRENNYHSDPNIENSIDIVRRKYINLIVKNITNHNYQVEELVKECRQKPEDVLKAFGQESYLEARETLLASLNAAINIQTTKEMKLSDSYVLPALLDSTTYTEINNIKCLYRIAKEIHELKKLIRKQLNNDIKFDKNDEEFKIARNEAVSKICSRYPGTATLFAFQMHLDKAIEHELQVDSTSTDKKDGRKSRTKQEKAYLSHLLFFARESWWLTRKLQKDDQGKHGAKKLYLENSPQPISHAELTPFNTSLRKVCEHFHYYSEKAENINTLKVLLQNDRDERIKQENNLLEEINIDGFVTNTKNRSKLSNELVEQHRAYRKKENTKFNKKNERLWRKIGIFFAYTNLFVYSTFGIYAAASSFAWPLVVIFGIAMIAGSYSFANPKIVNSFEEIGNACDRAIDKDESQSKKTSFLKATWNYIKKIWQTRKPQIFVIALVTAMSLCNSPLNYVSLVETLGLMLGMTATALPAPIIVFCALAVTITAIASLVLLNKQYGKNFSQTKDKRYSENMTIKERWTEAKEKGPSAIVIFGVCLFFGAIFSAFAAGISAAGDFFGWGKVGEFSTAWLGTIFGISLLGNLTFNFSDTFNKLTLAVKRFAKKVFRCSKPEDTYQSTYKPSYKNMQEALGGKSDTPKSDSDADIGDGKKIVIHQSPAGVKKAVAPYLAKDAANDGEGDDNDVTVVTEVSASSSTQSH